MPVLVHTGFIGREVEFDVLRLAADSAIGGGRCVLVAGEPGIGKTRTAEELSIRARDRGVRVLWGHCWEAQGAPAFWPWGQLIRAGLKALGDEGRAQLTSGIDTLAVLMPNAQDVLGHRPQTPPVDSAPSRFQLFEAVHGFFSHLSQAAPLMLVLDDLHGADHSSLLLFQFLSRQVRDLPVLLLGTYRDVGLAPDHPLSAMLVEAMREPATQRIVLHGFSEAEVARYVHASTGNTLPAAQVQMLRRQTDGNPLFLGELVRALASDGDLQSTLEATAARTSSLPLGVQAIVERRLAPLADATRQLLSVAAVIGREFRLDVLQHVVATVPPAVFGFEVTSAATAAELLAAAAMIGVVQEMDTSRRYRFSHALIRETLYNRLPPLDRGRLHRCVGEAIAPLPDATDHLAELAYHFVEAVRTDPEQQRSATHVQRAIEYAQRAGERALAQLAYEEAVHLFQLGLDAAARSTVPEQQHAARSITRTPHDRGRCELLLGLGDALKYAGETVRAIACYLEAAELARRLSEAVLLARAATGCKLNDASADGDPQLISLLEEARLGLGTADSAMLARVLGSLANELARVPGQRSRGAALSRDAVAMARRIGDPVALVQAFRHWYEADYNPDNLDERLVTAHELVHLADRLHSPSVALEGLRIRVAAELERGDLAAVERAIEAFDGAAHALRQPQWLAWVPIFQCTLAMLQGRFASAEQLASAALLLGQEAQQPDAVPNYLVQLFTWRSLRGTLNAAEIDAAVAQYGNTRSWNAGWRAGVAWGYMELGRDADARGMYDELAVDDFAALPRDSSWLATLSLCAYLCAHFNDRQRAAALYTALLPYRSRMVTNPSATQCAGSVELYLGVLARTAERWTEAALHFDESLRRNQAMDAAAYVTLTQYEYAVLLACQRNEEGILAHLASALADAQRLGMLGVLEKGNTLRTKYPASPTPRVDGMVAQQPIPHQGAPAPSGPAVPATFRLEGGIWTIIYGGRAARLKNSRGLQYLASLLHHRGREVHVLDLVQGFTGVPEQSGNPRRGREATELVPLDAQAKAAYRDRLHELRSTLEDAEQRNDPGAAHRARVEIDMLTDQLTAAVGLGGRDRLVGAAGERARIAVTKRIKEALMKIGTVHPELAEHLKASVTTGYFCSYAPLTPTTTWQL